MCIGFMENLENLKEHTQWALKAQEAPTCILPL